MADVGAMLAEMNELLVRNIPAAGDGDPGLTVNEWAEAWKISPGHARRRINQLWQRGTIEVGRRPVHFMDGRPGTLPVYRPKMP